MYLRLAVAALLAAGCAGGSPSSAPTPSPTLARPIPTVLRTAGPSARPTGARVDKVLVVVLENHSMSEALDAMPRLRALASRYGTATASYAVAHPSLPNYLAIAAGSTFGVSDDAGPDAHPLSGQSVFGVALAHGRTARAYVEGLSRPCDQAGAGEYAVKHNPWAYFTDERSACAQGDVSLTQLTADARSGALPNVGLVVPNLCHDGHDCGLDVADSWLSGWVGSVTSGPDFRSGRLAVVITFDEDDRSQANRVLTVVVSRGLHGVTVTARLTHLNLCRWLSDVGGGRPLRGAAGVPSLGSYFGL